MSRAAAPQNPEPDGPRPVSKFEFNLLRILRFVFGQLPADQGLQLVRAGIARPACLSKAAVELVQDTLAKGCILTLVREGGWRNDPFLRQNAPARGRIWQRIPLDERVLEFSSHLMEFLLWVTAEKVNDTKQVWNPPINELTPADEYFLWRFFDACRMDPEIVTALRNVDAFRQNPFCWLASPGEIVANEEFTVPDFQPLLSGLRVAMLECLQPHLASRWLRSERTKGQIGDWKRMRLQGRAEFTMLQSFLAVVEKANRTDLARFILKTNAAILNAEQTPEFWTGGLQGSGPPRLADRLDTQRAALAIPRQMVVLERWQERAQYVSFFDDDYPASQLWKQEWEEAGGDRVAARARQVVEMLEPLRTPPGSGATATAEGHPADEVRM